LLVWGLWLATGESAKGDFSDGRTRLIPALEREMRLDKRISFPLAFPGFLRLYIALRFLTLSASTR
jgi:hypothetical protein